MKFDSYNPIHFIAMTLVVQGATGGFITWLLFEGYFGGDNMPDGVKIWGMAFIYVVSAWFMISHRPKHPK